MSQWGHLPGTSIDRRRTNDKNKPVNSPALATGQVWVVLLHMIPVAIPPCCRHVRKWLALA